MGSLGIQIGVQLLIMKKTIFFSTDYYLVFEKTNKVPVIDTFLSSTPRKDQKLTKRTRTLLYSTTGSTIKVQKVI